MNPAFWAERWREGKIGFHEGKPNAWLVAFADRLAGKARVLVPLCGKAADLAFLAARGHEVVGVELVEDAVRAFFAEHGLAPAVTPRGPLVEYRAGAIAIFAGDVFAATAERVGAIDAIYDRAALIALPPALRPRYVAHLRALAGPALHALTVTLEYDQDQMAGPPFSVPRAEVIAHYAGRTIDELASAPAALSRPDAPAAIERCFLVT